MTQLFIALNLVGIAKDYTETDLYKNTKPSINKVATTY